MVFSGRLDCSWRDGDHRLSPTAAFSELDLLGDPQRVVDFYTEVANCAFQFRVSEKDLDGAQVARLL
ncbi:hypothetical protein IHQ71_24365 [Rhizobium sp. TH2]|nr:hypothetical protein IHQ71_24365 [Rhizobium sp. TH2]